MNSLSAHGKRLRFLVVGVVLAAAGLSACGGNIDVGSDVLWTARFEGGTFDEWTGTLGGAAGVTSATGSIEVSGDQAHTGRLAAKLLVDAPSGTGAQAASMSRKGGLPAEGYYSAWYYLPSTVTVGQYWVIFKFRRRAVADDPSSEGELFDVDLVNDASGGMTIVVFDHRAGAVAPLQVADLVVPVGAWFQLEALYRNASDATGALAVWFNGEAVLDLEGQATSPTPWIEWDVLSLGNELSPSMATLFVDDCAVSVQRVGPDRRISD